MTPDPSLRDSPRRALVAIRLLLLAAGAAVLAEAGVVVVQPGQPEPWFAPARAAKKVNPFKADSQSIDLGKRVFERECLSCHGARGAGDGPKATELERRPGNLSLPAMWDQSDGALFWKISEGRAPMPATKTLISDDERWHVINYIRTLATPGSAPTPPKSVVPETHRKAVSAALRAYEAVRVALGGAGDGAGAAKAAPALADALAALRATDPAGVPDAAKSTWTEGTGACVAAAERLKNAGADVAKLREAFGPVSAAVMAVVEQYGHAEAGPVLVFVETAPGGGDGPSCLQTDPKVQDPYGAAADMQTPRRRLGAQQKP